MTLASISGSLWCYFYCSVATYNKSKTPFRPHDVRNVLDIKPFDWDCESFHRNRISSLQSNVDLLLDLVDLGGSTPTPPVGPMATVSGQSNLNSLLDLSFGSNPVPASQGPPMINGLGHNNPSVQSTLIGDTSANHDLLSGASPNMIMNNTVQGKLLLKILTFPTSWGETSNAL